VGCVRTFRLPFVAYLLALLATAYGQIGPGSLSGIVSDPRGEALPEAPVQIKSKTTGKLARTVSSDDGRYSFTNLAGGSYEMSIVMPCCAYETFRKDVTVAGGQATQLNARLTETINGTTLGDDPGRTAAAMRKRAKIPSRPVPRVGGRPDLSGVWLDTGDPYPEQAELLPWASAIVNNRREDHSKDAPHNHCLPGNIPLPGASTPFIGKFVQTPGLLVILFEDVPGFRQVFLDGRRHPANLDPTWMGHSVGKWEGDTLVVDTIGFNDRSWLQGIMPHTEMLRMTERYRRVDFGHLYVSVTFDDPGTFMKPLHVNSRWNLAPQEDLLEFVCENNKPEHLVGK
jgi:hypothetical protein